jgi:hypothetical protein
MRKTNGRRYITVARHQYFILKSGGRERGRRANLPVYGRVALSRRRHAAVMHRVHARHCSLRL